MAGVADGVISIRDRAQRKDSFSGIEPSRRGETKKP
jgi:hypothetical protein